MNRVPHYHVDRNGGAVFSYHLISGALAERTTAPRPT